MAKRHQYATDWKKELPTFKPNSYLIKKTPGDKFIKPPFIEGENLVIGYYFTDNRTLTKNEEELFESGKLTPNTNWFYTSVKLGPHKNKGVLGNYFVDQQAPEEVAALYEAPYQFRAALGLEHATEQEKDAENAYGWYCYLMDNY